MNRLVARAGVASAMLLVTAHSAADSATARSAEALFQEGKDLMSAGRLADACPKLAESQRLDPGTGTLMALAICHERQGWLASSVAEYRGALAQSERDGRDDRVSVARAALTRLEATVPRVTLSIPDEVTSLPGVRIIWAGRELPRASWGDPLLVDPGEYDLSVEAPAHRPFRAHVRIDQPGTRHEIGIPPLAGDVPAAKLDGPVPEAPSDRPAAWRAPAGYAGLGLGVVAIGFGSAFALKAKSNWDDVKAKCDPAHCGTTSAQQPYDDARSQATIATIGFGVGVAAIAAGVYFLVSAPRSTGDTRSVRVLPVATRGGGAFAITGAF